MLRQIIKYLDDELLSLGFHEKVHGLAEMVEREDQIYPAIYKGNGEYSEVTDFDQFNGSAYWRLIGSVATDEDYNENISNRKYLTITYPLRLVSVIPRKNLIKDDTFGDDEIVQAILSKIAGRYSSLKTQLKARRVEGVVNRWNINRNEVQSEEITGQTTRIGFEYSIVSIDISIIVQVNENCFQNICT